MRIYRGRNCAHGAGLAVVMPAPYLVEQLCDGNGRPGYLQGFTRLTKEDCTKIYELML